MNTKVIFPLIFITALFASLALVLTGCGSGKEAPPAEKAQKTEKTTTSTNELAPKLESIAADKPRDDTGTIVVKTHGFSIDNPENWTIETDNGDPEIPLILTQKDGNTTANVVVVVEKVDSLLTSKVNFEASVASLNSTLKDYNKISEGRIGGFYSVTFTHNSNGQIVKQTVYNLVKNAKGYTIAATDFIETFDSNAPILERIASSFKLL
ncbi:MAG: hypothetical protein L3J51_03290 [Cocleimonas sp.]|nr:hypothetical protein [Cocleimonas sp.]